MEFILWHLKESPFKSHSSRKISLKYIEPHDSQRHVLTPPKLLMSTAKKKRYY